MSALPRILVCGGRDFNNKELLYTTLDNICLERGWCTPPDKRDEYGNWLPEVHIISGMARGADTIAVDWAVVNFCNWSEYPADWARYGKSAGPIRNLQMLEEGKPDLVVAFPGGRGTTNMVKLARDACFEVIEVTE